MLLQFIVLIHIIIQIAAVYQKEDIHFLDLGQAIIICLYTDCCTVSLMIQPLILTITMSISAFSDLIYIKPVFQIVLRHHFCIQLSQMIWMVILALLEKEEPALWFCSALQLFCFNILVFHLKKVFCPKPVDKCGLTNLPSMCIPGNWPMTIK